MHTQNGRRQYIRNDAPILNVGCGRCLWCRIQRRREWTLRLIFESELHKDKWFLTLTYDDTNNPGTLIKKDLQLFMKRLRKRLNEKKIRYYAVGEYGENTARPHYHAILFNCDEADLEIRTEQLPGGKTRLISGLCEKIWPVGYNVMGSVTIESIQYVAGYVHKKLYGKDKYPEGITPPFALMSKLIGYNYFISERFHNVQKNGTIKLRGKDVNVPRSYIRKLKRANDKHHDLKNYKIEGQDHENTLKKIKQRGLDNFRSRIYKHTGVGHEDDMQYEDYQQLDRLAKAEAEAVDYYLKQRLKNNSQGKKL